MATSEWTNPRAADRYDLVIVGGDALAILAAEFALDEAQPRRRRLKIALASDHPLGLDAQRHAMRTALWLSAESACRLSEAPERGWPGAAAAGRFDFEPCLQLGERLAAAATDRFSAERLRDRGVDVFLGPMVFQSPQALRVAGQTLAFARALLAPRADWAPPPIAGAETVDFRTPDDLATLAEWPRHWAIVGSSGAACELAWTFARLGSAVDLIAEGPLVSDAALGIADGHSIEIQIAAALEAAGVRLWRGQKIISAARAGAANGLLIERDGKSQWIVADEMLVVARRAYDLGWLRPELAGIAMHEGEVLTDRSFAAAQGQLAVVPPRELPEFGEDERLIALARRAARAGLGIREPWPPPPIARRLKIEPRFGWIGECGSAPPGARMVDRLTGPPVGIEGIMAQLRLRVDTRKARLVGAIVAGAGVETLLPALEQMLLDGVAGPARARRQAEWEWLGRLVVEMAESQAANSKSLVGCWRRWRMWRRFNRGK